MEDKVAGLDAGADDYLVKSSGMVVGWYNDCEHYDGDRLNSTPATSSRQSGSDYGAIHVRLQDQHGQSPSPFPLTAKGISDAEYFMKHERCKW